MTKPPSRASVPFSEPADQLGCVVPDLAAAISEWVAKGVGPFLTLPGVTLDCFYRGRKSKPKIGSHSASRATSRSSSSSP